MKKCLFLLVLVIAAGLTSCPSPEPGVDPSVINFYANDALVGTVTATFDQAMPALSWPAPTRMGYEFFGYCDTNGIKYYNADLSSAKKWDKKGPASLYARWDAKTVTITFNSNGGTGGPVSVQATYDEPLPVLTGVPPSFAGIFNGYWDEQTGGVQYYTSTLAPVAEKTWDKDTDTTLYARWSNVPVTTISFFANGGEGNMPSQEIQATTTVALTPNAFTRTGYYFAGWNTASNGTGISYANSANYVAAPGTNSVTLYAQWTAIPVVTIIFNANGGTGTMADQQIPVNTSANLNPNTFTRVGYTFYKWNLAPNGNWTMYSDQESFAAGTVEDQIILYALWVGTDYTVSFNQNGGSGGQTANVTATYGSAMPAITTVPPTLATKTFNGYWDAATGGLQYYTSALASARSWNKTDNATLYAQWTDTAYTTVSFSANGGVGTAIPNMTVYYGTPQTLPVNTFTYAGFTFANWNTLAIPSAEAPGISYADGATFTAGDAMASVRLNAQWTAKTYTVSFNNGSGTGGQASPVTATFAQPMPFITAVPTPPAGKLFSGYWDAATGGVKYYNPDMSSALVWNIDSNATLYAQFIDEPPVVLASESIVSLVQHRTVTQASNFTQAQILELTREVIDLAGGLGGIVKTGDTVVLKPNLVSTYQNWNIGGTPFQALVNGVCTDWRVTHAVATIVREIIGPTGKIYIMEGSAGGNMQTQNFPNMGYITANFPTSLVDAIIGLDYASEGTTFLAGGSTTNTGITDYNVQVSLSGHKYTTVPTGSWSSQYSTYQTYYKGDGKYWVNKKMYDADAFISIPVLKNHWDACVTGGIKNISIGCAPPKVYGGSTSNPGRNGMVNHNTDNLHQWIADFFSCLPADFTVMDGLQGMSGGPGRSSLTKDKNMRCMLASRDALALDITEANIMNWDYAILNYMSYLAQRGTVGPRNPRVQAVTLRGNPKDIVVLGNKKVDDIRTTFEGNMQQAAQAGQKLTTAQLTKPTLTIGSAAFSGNNLNLTLTPSTGANNTVVKVEVYIDGTYKKSFNTNMNNVTVDCTGLASGSYSIEVRAYTKYMSCDTKTTTATK